MYDVRGFSQGNLSTSGCSGNYANVRDERNPFVEGIERTRDEAKSAYAITFPLPTMAVLCSRTYITTGK